MKFRTKERISPLPRAESSEMSEAEIVKVFKIALAWGEDFWTGELGRFEKSKGWGKQFWDANARPTDISGKLPKLVLFHGKTREASSQVFVDEPIRKGETILSRTGPLFHARDNSIYVDPSALVRVLKNMLPNGRLTPLIVAIAALHEYGHWVQERLGISQLTELRIRAEKGAMRTKIHNTFETEADFLAATVLHAMHKKKGILDPADFKEATDFIGARENTPLLAQLAERVLVMMGHPVIAHSNPADRAKSMQEGLDTGVWVERLLKDQDIVFGDLRDRLKELCRMDQDTAHRNSATTVG